MFYKKKYIQALQEIEELTQKQNELLKYVSAHRNAVDNIHRLHDLCGSNVITSFCIDKDIFCSVLNCATKRLPIFRIYNMSYPFKNVAEDAIAFCYAHLIPLKTGSTYYCVLQINDLRVKERRKGFGSRILQAAINYARSSSCHMVYGTMKRDLDMTLEELCQFYKKNGFTVEGGGFRMDLPDA